MTNILFPTDTTWVTPATWDIIMIADVSDSNNPKDCTLAELPISTATQTALDAKQATISGLTASGAELNILDGATLSTTELNYVDGVTSAIQTQLDGKQATLVSWTNIKTINGSSVLGSGDLVVSGVGSVATDSIWDTKGDLAVGTGANTASRLAVGANGQVLTADSAEATWTKWSNPAGGGDALTSGTLAQFASTTSAQLAGVISDETGSGALVFATSPTLVTPVLGVATATSINGATITSGTLNGSVTGTNTGDQTSIVGLTGTMAQFDTAVTDGNIVYQSQALGTPASGTLTNCTGLPLSGVVDSTSEALGVWSIELWHATDTTLSRVSAGQLGIEWVRAVTTSPLVLSAASYTTDTGTSLDMDNLDMFIVTAQAGALLFNAPGGTLVQGRKLIIRIKDNWTSRALTYNAVFRAIGVTLPTATTISKTTYMWFVYNSTDTKWDCIAIATEA